MGDHGDCTHLLNGTACGTIGDIRSRELERPPTIVAAAGVELRGMVREDEQMPLKKLIEARTGEEAVEARSE